MIKPDQRRRAQTLLDLHSGARLLVLPNVWNPIGARVLASKGHKAIATASAAVSSALGFVDGETITRGTMLEVVTRIRRAVDIPVTADMEAGYAATLDELAATTTALIETGAVGMNIEDSIVEGKPLRPADEQAARIAKVRETAASHDLHLVINARIDSFVTGEFASLGERIDDAVERAKIYARAGADCVYPIGPGDEETLRILRSRIASPINALASANAVPLETMAAIGINRVTFGPFIFRSCLRKFAEIVDALARAESYECFSNETFTRAETAPFLSSDPEDDPAD